MSANLNPSAGYNLNATQNGGAAPPCQNGPGQTYPSVYHAAGYYSSHPQSYPPVMGQGPAPSGKAPVMNSQYHPSYYHNSHPQPVQPTVRAGPPVYDAAQTQVSQSCSATGAPPSSAHHAPQHPPPFKPLTSYPAPYYAPYPASQGLAATAASSAPLYPVASYSSAPGANQYSTVRSSQAPQAQLYQGPPGIGAPPTAVSTAPCTYARPPSGPQVAVNGQVSAVSSPVLQHYDQTQPVVTQSYKALDGDGAGERPPSGTPSNSVHSSPGHHPGADSSTTGSSSPVPNNYESLEDGSYPDSSSLPPPPPSSKAVPPFGYSYPNLHPAYQQKPASRTDTTPSYGGCNPPGYQPFSQPFPNMSQLSTALGGLSGVPELQVEGLRPVNLLQERNILPPSPLPDPEPNLSADLRKVNCSPDTFRCTLTNIPQTQALLNKAKLPLGLLLHPFRDLTQLPVITSNTIVRCRSCRTYINPFVTFLDQRRWKCNLCYRVNDVPDEFMYNPVTRSYGEPHKRPEVQNSTVEFIASSDYMLRPPQPAVYLFVLDVSHNAVETGYLTIFCQSLLDNLDKLPGDTRTRLGFVTFDSTIHFYNLQEGLSQPQMLVVSDIEDIFLPTPDSLLVNLKESRELVKDLLSSLPGMFTHTRETHSALGPALQAAYKLMSPTGGRVSVFQTQLPTQGAGLLQSREDPNLRSSTKGVQHLGPATDFYKKLALDCSGQQIAVDLFLLTSQYSDLASLACVAKYSAGSIYYYPSFHHVHNLPQLEKFQKDLQRYLTRKIGFEAVMRIRCTKGLSIHTFHGNFFVRSTDLLSLANVNPDSGFAVQMSIDESLADTSLTCFQAALLYTSSKGKRRIRVHTLCLPVVSQLSDVFAGADIQAVTCLLANMAIDRSVSSSLSDARDALVNAVVDSLSAYRNTSNLQPAGLVAPSALRLFPLYVLALLKQKALRTGTSTRLDDRVFAMCEFKSQPLQHVMRLVHPNLYRVDNLSDQGALHLNDRMVPQPQLLQLTAEKLTREGAFLMDCGSLLYLWVGKSCSEPFIRDVLGCPDHSSIPQNMSQIPELDNPSSARMRTFLSWLQESRSFWPVLHVVKDDASAKTSFFQHLVEDRTESAFSYYEFLLHIQQQMSK
ncbi:protein transport protein Sec24B isoform X3 [Paramormyrops kingsleyae]|uniref:SEC24 homolog B, COPII coat complex component n=1 Tax=Paramormyrops kingsleyae TaxID=1676925 RepID=A0A3B3T5H7_9TELE|nr:protein transport protein Sec24B isoform X3 [Paramormyrops kingsleyae]